MFIDVFVVAIGAVFMKEYDKGWYQPIYYASRRMNAMEKNYTYTKGRHLKWYIIFKSSNIILSVGKESSSTPGSPSPNLFGEQTIVVIRMARCILLPQEYN